MASLNRDTTVGGLSVYDKLSGGGGIGYEDNRVDGEDNVIIGENNSIFGDNNLIIGNNIKFSGYDSIIIKDNYTFLSYCNYCGFDNNDYGVTETNNYTTKLPLFDNSYEVTILDPLPPLNEPFMAIKSCSYYSYDSETLTSNYGDVKHEIETSYTAIEYDSNNNPWGILSTPFRSFTDADLPEGTDWDSYVYVNTYHLKKINKTPSITGKKIIDAMTINPSELIFSGKNIKMNSKIHINDSQVVIGGTGSSNLNTFSELTRGGQDITLGGGNNYSGGAITGLGSNTYRKNAFSIGNRNVVVSNAIQLQNISISGTTVSATIASSDTSDIAVGKHIVYSRNSSGGAIGFWDREYYWTYTTIKTWDSSTKQITFTTNSGRTKDYPNILPFPIIFLVKDSSQFNNQNFPYTERLSATLGSHNAIGANNAFCFGRGLWNTTDNCVMIGTYTSSNVDSLFEIGNGVGMNPTYTYSSGASVSWSTGKCFRVNNTGQTFSNGAYNSTGADYAELFEWADGNLNKEDRIGLAVTLVSDKIKIANKEDEILGFVSANPGIIGDNYDMEWNNKYLKDAFGRLLYEDVLIPETREYFYTKAEIVEYKLLGEEVTEKDINKYIEDHPESLYPLEDKDNKKYRIIKEAYKERQKKLNPDYDDTLEYIARQDRKEWAIVGVIGKIPVYDDGSCKVDGYAKLGEAGKLTQSETKTNYKVIKRLDPNIVMIWVK